MNAHPSWHERKPAGGQPRPSPTALPVLAEGVPPFEQFGPSRQLVLEPAERASSADGDTELVHLVSVVECGDEEFHVAISRAGTLALDPQPPLLSSSMSPVSSAYSIAEETGDIDDDEER